MFAVPGWNLSAPLATQIEKAKPKDGPEGKKAKKRKQKAQEQVDQSNVGEYWEKVVEGKGKSEKKAQAVDGAEQLADEAPEKKGKKRKRTRDKGRKETGDGDGDGQTKPNGHVEQDSTVAGAELSVADTKPTDDASKREKKKRKKEQKLQNDADVSKATPKNAITTPLIPEPKGLTLLQRTMRAKLTSARFRHLNESLYTKPSKESLDLFKESPEMFEDYHRGFAQQVEVWPENPVDSYVETILTRGKQRTKDPWKDKKRKEKGKHGAQPADADPAPPSTIKPLPRNLKGHSTIADLGCGTASLSHRLQPSLKHLNLTLHSFDLSKPPGPTAPLVTIADIAALPLPSATVDVAIFCLALMGTNWLDFIDEAWRVLRWRGELWVSEIKSRFGRVAKGKVPINSVGSLRKPDKKLPPAKKAKKGDSTGIKESEEGIQGSDDEAELAERVDGVQGKEGTDVSAFVEVLRKRGFVLDALPERQNDAIDLSNKMFVKMQFVKGAPPTKGKNVKKEEEGGRADRGVKMGMGIKGRKFAAVADDDDGEKGGDEVDGKVLKPCLYKIR